MEIQWSLVIFTVLTGAGGWMLAGLAIDEFAATRKMRTKFTAAIVALVLLVVGGCASVTHLSHPENMLNALQHPTSGIFVEALLIGVTAVLVIAMLVALRKGASAGACKILAVLAAVFGVLLSFMAGASYMMDARPAWNTVLLPLAYAGTAAPAGIAAYVACVAASKEEGLRLQGCVLAVCGCVAAVTAAAFALAEGGNQDATMVWLGAVVVGGMVPAALGIVIARMPRSGLAAAVVACGAALVGAACLRCFMWLLPTGISNFFGLIY